jgi:signal transduction histidine kinase
LLFRKVWPGSSGGIRDDDYHYKTLFMNTKPFPQTVTSMRAVINDGAPPQTRCIPMIIHEIRNPLTAIKIANQVLADTAGDQLCEKEFRQMLTGIINRNMLRIESLVDELRDITPDQSVKFERIELCDVINDAVSATSDRLFLNGVRVIKTICPDTFIRGNAEKLSLAFQNLIVNSIEAMVDEDREIWIVISKDKELLKVEVKDNGKGMDAERAKHLFEPAPSLKHPGKSMGLSYVREILKWHGATIQADGEVGAGTIVTIFFPLDQK